jgi:hypothetical protein
MIPDAFAQLRQAGRRGILPQDQRFELIGGEVVPMSP